METATERASVNVAGCGAVTALGAGIGVLDESLRKGESGLFPVEVRMGPGHGMQRLVAGRVPESVVDRACDRLPEVGEDRAFRMATMAAREAFEQAGEFLQRTPSRRQGLVVSTTKASIDALERWIWKEPVSEAALARVQPGRFARDCALALGVTGPVQCVSAACISGLLALRQGAAMIQRGQADVVHVVGVDVLSAFVVAGFASLKSMDPEGCRPFDRRRVGLSLGEGAGAMVLMRGDRDVPGTRLIGWGISNDANHLTGPSRDGAGLALAMNRALAKAGRPGREVDCLHAHGTGTPYNDAMESLAFRTVFPDPMPSVVASKGALGHTLGAAGVLESIICVRAMELGLLPGTPRLGELDPVAPASMILKPTPKPGLRTIMKVNSGFGGTNAALVFERSHR
ncbi:MAG: beta-ketoacyl-[acyl-carrier-protein] synthase family protein [Verrucomicrobiales bacterium]|nr:beta-ketoacyl-[acyl-carrier-protein] synthase family protein [Verrucomicrobiales bacterium]